MEKGKLQKIVLQPNKYRVSTATFIEFIFFWTIAMEFLVTELELPGAIRYANDAIVLLLIARIVPNFSRLNVPQYKWVILSFLAFFAVIVAGVIGNLVPMRYVVWGGRNTFRFFVYFFACAMFLNRKNIERVMTMLLGVQLLNIILAIYQFFVLGRWSDDLGGVFGFGNTTGTCTLCLLLVTYYFIKFMNKEASIVKFVFAMATTMVISALAEQKALYLLLVAALIMSVVLTGFSFRKFIAIVLCLVAFVVGMNILGQIASESVEILTDVDQLLEYSQTTYSEGYRFPRIGSFSIIDEKFFGGNWFNKAFGLGLGNCDDSDVAFFKSDFYRMYGYYNYRWFTHQWIFIENGYFGVITMVGFWVVNAISLFFYRKKSKPQNRTIIDTSIVCSISAILLMWLGPALKVDAGYLIYFSAAMGLAVLRDTIDERGYTKVKKSTPSEIEELPEGIEEKPDISEVSENIKLEEKAEDKKIKDDLVLKKKGKNHLSQFPDIHLEKGSWVNKK